MHSLQLLHGQYVRTTESRRPVAAEACIYIRITEGPCRQQDSGHVI